MSRYTQVTDELLSAYLDDDVTASERMLVETAVADDPEIAWRLATLQYTVNLLGKLPELQLPRSFALTEAMVAEPVTEGAGVPIPASRPANEPEKAGFWQAWRSFWQGGNPLMRNAAAASFAAFLVLAVAGSMLSTQEMQMSQQADIALSAPIESAMQPDIAGVDPARQNKARSYAPSEAREKLPAPSEPIPLPAASADEADSVAMASANEANAAPLAERASASLAEPETDAPSAESAVAENIAEETEESAMPEPALANTQTNTIEAEPEPIGAAALIVAEAPVAEEEADSLTDEANDDAALEELGAVASVSEPNAQNEESAKIQNEKEPEDETAFAATTTESQTPPPVAMSDTDDAAVVESVIDDESREEHKEVIPATVEVAVVAEAAESVEVVELPLPRPESDAQPAAISATNDVESDPLPIVQLSALGLGLLFTVLWLLSRNAKPTPAKP